MPPKSPRAAKSPAKSRTSPPTKQRASSTAEKSPAAAKASPAKRRPVASPAKTVSSSKPPVLVLTFATEETAYFPALRASAAAQGFRFEVIGLGQQWQGFIWANSLMMERARQCNPDELVLVLDGYDTLVTMRCEQMLAKYDHVCALATEKAGFAPPSPRGRWVIFGIEHPRTACTWLYWNTMMRMARRYHLVPSHGTYYLNTGAILGPAKHVLTYMEQTCEHAKATGNKDDQNTANALFWERWAHPEEVSVSRADAPLPIALDMLGDLFYCHCERRLAFLLFNLGYRPNNQRATPGALELRDGAVFATWAGKPVGVIHGIWNTNLNAVCAYLGYPYNSNYHKKVSQPDIRMFQEVTLTVLVLLGLGLVALSQPEAAMVQDATRTGLAVVGIALVTIASGAGAALQRHLLG